MAIDVTRLIAALNNTRLQQTDNALYQVINQIIKALAGVTASVGGLVITSTPGPPGPPGVPIFLFGRDGGGGGTHLIIPGTAGSPGPSGAAGTPGQTVPGFIFQRHEPTYAIPVPGNPGPQGPSGSAAVAWTLFASNTGISGTNVFNYTGLAPYTEVQVFIRDITYASTDNTIMEVSIDNGANYLTALGDYQGVLGSGTTSAKTNLQFYDANATTARSGSIWIANINLTSPKISRSNFFSTDGLNLRYIPTANAITALRVRSNSANNFTGGDIYVFAR